MGYRFQPEAPSRHDLRAAGLSDARAVLDFARRGTVVSQASSLVVRRHTLGGCATYAKLYDHGPLCLRYFLRPSRARCEYRSCQHLRRAGLHCPDVVCLAEQRRFGCVRWAVLVTREVAAAVDLVEAFARMPDAAARRAVLGQLASALARMHNAGFYHRNLRFRNVLLQRTAPDTMALHFIDSPTGRAWSVNPTRDALSDLISLGRDLLSVCRPQEWALFRDQYGASRNRDLHRHLADIPERCQRRFGVRVPGARGVP